MNKAPRVIAIGLAIVILFALIAYNAANPGKPNFVAWNENMTLGDKETAKHHYVMYTDLFCPYCDKFSLAVKAHKDEFQKEYLDKTKDRIGYEDAKNKWIAEVFLLQFTQILQNTLLQNI